MNRWKILPYLLIGTSIYIYVLLLATFWQHKRSVGENAFHMVVFVTGSGQDTVSSWEETPSLLENHVKCISSGLHHCSYTLLAQCMLIYIAVCGLDVIPNLYPELHNKISPRQSNQTSPVADRNSVSTLVDDSVTNVDHFESAIDELTSQ